MITEVFKCRLCGSADIKEILNLGEQTLTGVFPKSKQQQITRGPIILVKCFGENSCGLVQMKHSYDLGEMYGDNYGYRSGINASMVSHLGLIVSEIKSLVKLSPGDTVIDVGSNDSTLLQAYGTDLGLNLVGVDPTGKKFEKYYPPHIKLIPDFFPCPQVDEMLKGKKAKVITSISMFYDLEDPQTFVNHIANILDNNGVWVFEQSYLPSMIETLSFDTVCHEHLEYYALKQIEFMLKNAKLKIANVSLNNVNGGSFRITATHESSSLPVNTSAIEKLVKKEKEMSLEGLEIWSKFSKDIENLRSQIVTFFQEAKNRNELVVGLGASTKGNVLLQWCKITADQMPYIAEVNTDKFGSFTPGTNISIISEDEANLKNPKFKFILPWHFKESFIKREASYLERGGVLVFPLPEFQMIRKDS